MSGIVSVYAVFGDRAEAERIGRMVLEDRLAACVNLLGEAHSIYRWRGKVEEADEVPAIFKTAATSAEALVKRIAALHSYENPAVVVWPVSDAPEAYARWVKEQMR